MEDATAQLIAEQLGRFRDQLEARMRRLEDDTSHNKELSIEKLLAIRDDIALVKEVQHDHETRIRSLVDAVIALRTTGGLVQAGQAVLTILAASIAAWLGVR